MRECHGLVDAMIHYVNSSLEVGKSEDKVSLEICSAQWAWGFSALRWGVTHSLVSPGVTRHPSQSGENEAGTV